MEYVTTRLFEERIDQLEAFKEVHGHLHVTNALDKQLASYCRQMRQARWKPNSGRLNVTEEKIMALDELGFEWNVQLQHTHTNVRILRSFEERIEQLTAFKEVHGHLRVTRALDKNLADFCVRMREAHRKPDSGGMMMTEERIKAVEELGFEWESARTRSFEQLVEQ